MNLRRPTKPMIKPAYKRPLRRNGPANTADYRRRVAAAGIRPDADPAAMPIDDFRLALARCLSMAINRWNGCREPLCRRNRGCMAPRGACSNAPRTERDPVAEARAMAQIQRRLTQELERRGLEG